MDYSYCPRCATALTEHHDGERMRATCPACRFVHYDNPLPVVAAVVEHEGQVILANNRAWPPSMFGLVTGFLEKGETPEEGVAREVKEELDLDAQQVTLIGVYPFRRRNELIIAYAVQATGTVRLSEELAAFRSIEPAKLRPWKMGTGYALADWMRARNLPFEWLAF
jgi:NAD+ diphosphatase